MPSGPWAEAEATAPSRALARWVELRSQYNETGLWPVIVPSAEDLGRFEARWAETREEFEEIEGPDLDLAPKRVAVPTQAPGLDAPNAEAVVTALLQQSGEAWIVTLPCQEPAEIPARLLQSGDLCPSPEEHLAVLRRWRQTHGAEPLLVGWDTLILLVRPLRSVDEALRVYQEMLDYCGEGEIGEYEAIAEHLVGFPAWFFWWD